MKTCTAFDVIFNRRYKFNVQKRDGSFFAVPYHNGILEEKKAFQLHPRKDGDAAFNWDFFLFIVNLNRITRTC